MKATYINLFSDDVWQSVSEQMKRRALRWIVDCVSENLRLRHKPNLKFIHIPPTNVGGNEYYAEYGKYSAQNNTVYLNDCFFNRPYELVETLAHELRHAWQFQISKKRDNKQSVIMANNFMNYVSYTDDSTHYNYQPLERDARRYAKEVREMVEKMSKDL